MGLCLLMGGMEEALLADSSNGVDLLKGAGCTQELEHCDSPAGVFLR